MRIALEAHHLEFIEREMIRRKITSRAAALRLIIIEYIDHIDNPKQLTFGEVR